LSNFTIILKINNPILLNSQCFLTGRDGGGGNITPKSIPMTTSKEIRNQEERGNSLVSFPEGILHSWLQLQSCAHPLLGGNFVVDTRPYTLHGDKKHRGHETSNGGLVRFAK